MIRNMETRVLDDSLKGNKEVEYINYVCDLLRCGELVMMACSARSKGG